MMTTREGKWSVKKYSSCGHLSQKREKDMCEISAVTVQNGFFLFFYTMESKEMCVSFVFDRKGTG